MTAFFIFFIGCFFKTYSLNGQLRDSNGRPVHNAIVKVDASQVETRSDNKGRFNLEIKYKKKNEPYMLDVIALAHKKKSLELFLEEEKDKEIKRKMILEPKIIRLPYRKINMDLDNLDPVHPPTSVESEEDDAEEDMEEAETQTSGTEGDEAEEGSIMEKSNPDATPVDEPAKKEESPTPDQSPPNAE